MRGRVGRGRLLYCGGLVPRGRGCPLPIGHVSIALKESIACPVLVLCGARLALRVAVKRGIPAGETLDNLSRRVRVALQDAADRGARRRLGLVDEAQGKLAVLPLFYRRMGRPLYIERRQRKQ